MSYREKCRSCEYNPGLGGPVCQHASYVAGAACPLEVEEAYDVAYKAGVTKGIEGTKIILTELIYNIKDKTANEVMDIVKEFAEAL